MEMASFSLENVCTFSPGLCPTRALAQTLAGLQAPLCDNELLPWWLSVWNFSYRLLLELPFPLACQDTWARLCWSLFLSAPLDLHILSPDPVDMLFCLLASTPCSPWLFHPNGKIKFFLVFPHAAANEGVPGCVLRNNGWRKQQSLLVAVKC